MRLLLPLLSLLRDEEEEEEEEVEDATEYIHRSKACSLILS